MKTKIPLVTEITLSAQFVRSLVWAGDFLVDWAGGGARYALDGRFIPSAVNYAFLFDAAIATPDGRCAVIYQKLGTKGLVLKDGKILREINRSFYHAHAYEYPVAVSQLPDGRHILLHCPDDYNRLEIDDFLTGERLTVSASRKPQDFFHSRLSISRNGRFALSAGWVWQPTDGVLLFDLALAIHEPNHLDECGFVDICLAEESCAVFDVTGRAWVALYGDINEEIELNEVRVIDPTHTECEQVFKIKDRAGSIFPIGNSHVLSLYEHPKLIELGSGKVVQSWSHINSGKQHSSILINQAEVPVMVFDCAGQRVAIAGQDGISVLVFET